MRKRVLGEDYLEKTKKHLEKTQVLISSILPILESEILILLGENGVGLVQILLSAIAIEIGEAKKVLEAN